MAIRDRATEITGLYTLVLDDDDCFSDNESIGTLRKAVMDNYFPDMIIFQCDHRQLGILPEDQIVKSATKPSLGHVCSCSYITKSEHFIKNAGSFGNHYAGDYDFFSAAYDTANSVVFLRKVITVVPKISRGEREN